MEKALKADFALVKAWKADRWGNLVFRKTARNFNPVMATAARVTIAEVEEIVETGALNPDGIHVPSVYVKRVVLPRAARKKLKSARCANGPSGVTCKANQVKCGTNGHADLKRR